MAFLQVISAYRGESKSWPLWIDVDTAGKPLTLWKKLNAPDPQQRTLFQSYVPSIVIAIGNPIGQITRTLANLALCSRSLDFKMIIDEARVIFQTDNETILRNNTILSGFIPIDPRLARFICTSTVTTTPFLPQPDRILKLSAGTPTWRHFGAPMLAGRVTHLLIAELDVPKGAIESFVTQVEEVKIFFKLLPPFTTAEKPAKVFKPIKRPTACFDPTTGDPQDCDTAEPTEGDPCTEKWIKIPNPDDIIHLTPRPELPWEEVTSRRTGKKRWRLSRKLDAAETLEFLRRREIRKNIERSTVPEFVKSITDIMTTIDNIQDALLTAIIFARLGVKRLPRSLYKALVAGLGIADGLQIIAFGGLDLTRIRSVKGRLMKEGTALPFSKRWKQESVERLSRIVPT
ncbi:hypothetical protein LCGC14_0989410, partial [marine sediment metagenome]